MGNTTDQDISKKIVNLVQKYIQLRSIHTKDLAKKYGLSVVQLLCLQCLYENGKMSMSDIAENIMVNVSTLTRIIDLLEEKDLLARGRVSEDRRVITIVLTEKGRSLAENSPPVVHQRIVNAVNMLSVTEREEIFQALDTLTHLLDSGDREQGMGLACQDKDAFDSLRDYRQD